MKIIISPAKKMREDSDSIAPRSEPMFLERAEILLQHLRGLSYEELKKLLQCNDSIASLNFERFQRMDLSRDSACCSPAILSYDGIQYQYMGAQVLTEEALCYLEEHLRILSGFYGILRPLDGVTPYRLEMQAKVKTDFCRNLYDFWGSDLAKALLGEDCSVVLNLASAEYTKAVRPHLGKNATMVDVIFGEWDGDKIREKGVYVKMARGAMVRYLAERQAQSVEDVKTFEELGFQYCGELSHNTTLVFLRCKE